jgi:hypothetical protein
MLIDSCPLTNLFNANIAKSVLLENMRLLVETGGPTSEQYEWVNRWIQISADLISLGVAKKEDFLAFWRELGEEYSTETMQGCCNNIFQIGTIACQ